ncbi:MAG TPA: hypothetical protein VND93_19570, partial [Myxococcales bacterium]|nr:hypothetical protein [Myxococcales bacterium]
GHLAAVLQTTRAFAAPEVEQVLQRMVPLVAELGDAPELFHIRWKRFAFLQGRARHREALALARENLEIAERTGVTANRMIAHLSLGGGSLFLMGEYPEALRHLEAAAALLDPSWSSAAIASYGQDVGATVYLQKALVLSGTGALDAGAAAAAEGIALARATNQAHSVQQSLAIEEQHRQWRGDRDGVLRLFEELRRTSADQGVPQWEQFGSIIAAWAAAPADPTAPERMGEGVRAFQAAGALILSSYWSQLLADACLSLGRLDEAHQHVRAGLAFAESSGERFQEANLHRLRGEIFAASDEAGEAEGSFRAALDVARRQGALLQALHAAVSFSRLLVRHHRAAEARALLGPLSTSFAGGADLVLLQEARALLAALP